MNETTRCFLVKGGRIDGIDEAGGDDVQHLVEETRALLTLALLKYEASSHQRNQREAEEQSFSGSGHTA